MNGDCSAREHTLGYMYCETNCKPCKSRSEPCNCPSWSVVLSSPDSIPTGDVTWGWAYATSYLYQSTYYNPPWHQKSYPWAYNTLWYNYAVVDCSCTCTCEQELCTFDVSAQSSTDSLLPHPWPWSASSPPGYPQLSSHVHRASLLPRNGQLPGCHGTPCAHAEPHYCQERVIRQRQWFMCSWVLLLPRNSWYVGMGCCVETVDFTPLSNKCVLGFEKSAHFAQNYNFCYGLKYSHIPIYKQYKSQFSNAHISAMEAAIETQNKVQYEAHELYFNAVWLTKNWRSAPSG